MKRSQKPSVYEQNRTPTYPVSVTEARAGYGVNGISVARLEVRQDVDRSMSPRRHDHVSSAPPRLSHAEGTQMDSVVRRHDEQDRPELQCGTRPNERANKHAYDR
jgi:hypothetical protein